MNQTRFKKRKKKKILRRILFSFLIIFTLVGGAAAYLFYQTIQAANDSYTELQRGDKSALRDTSVKIGKEPVSILLLGIEDYASGKTGRSDTIMVATFNPDLGTMKLLSIPRDSKVYIPDKDKEDKINHAYNSGVESTIETVEQFLDIPIDYYATVNFDGFKDIIDEIGGIEVDVPFDFWEYTDTKPREKLYFTEGLMDLNGEEALAYARMRKRDPSGDFGRNERQKQVLMAAVDKTLTPSNLLNIDDIAKVVSQNVETNIRVTHLVSLVSKFNSFSSDSITSLKLEGTDSNTGIYYFMPSEESVAEIQTELKEHLNYQKEN
ncbi:MAG: LCP family protein [Bacillus sp. (in: firmicutes)]